MTEALAEPLRVAHLVGQVFESMGVDWAVGGSVASSLHGLPRSTQDVDIVARLLPSQAVEFVRALEDRFYVVEDSVMRAARGGGSFNVIHLDTMYKVDVFVVGDDHWKNHKLSRAEPMFLPDDVELSVLNPEDVIIEKLRWFRLGNELSERQWRDTLGVIGVQRNDLDFDYLQDWAVTVGVADLLKRALDESLESAE